MLISGPPCSICRPVAALQGALASVPQAPVNLLLVHLACVLRLCSLRLRMLPCSVLPCAFDGLFVTNWLPVLVVADVRVDVPVDTRFAPSKLCVCRTQLAFERFHVLLLLHCVWRTLQNAR